MRFTRRRWGYNPPGVDANRAQQATAGVAGRVPFRGQVANRQYAPGLVRTQSDVAARARQLQTAFRNRSVEQGGYAPSKAARMRNAYLARRLRRNNGY